MNTFGDFRYVYHITDWSRTGRTIGVLAGVTIALVTFHAFFCLVARLVMVIMTLWETLLDTVIIYPQNRPEIEYVNMYPSPHENTWNGCELFAGAGRL